MYIYICISNITSFCPFLHIVWLLNQDTHDECAKHGKVVHVTVDPRGTAGVGGHDNTTMFQL